MADDAADRSTGDQPAQIDIAGRWEGRTYEPDRNRGSGECDGKPCMMTLDVGRCGSGWCGVEVIGAEQRCGSTALKLNGGDGNPGGATVFKGHLELAKGTEPYVVEAYLVTMGEDGGAKRELQIVGDTGGEFRMFRRSFPFNATLVRISEPKCRPESTVSSLIE